MSRVNSCRENVQLQCSVSAIDAGGIDRGGAVGSWLMRHCHCRILGREIWELAKSRVL